VLAGVLDAGEHGIRVDGLDLEVLCPVGVAEGDRRFQVVDEDDRGLLAGQRLSHSCAVLRLRCEPVEFCTNPGRELGRIGDEDRGGQLIVLRLADEVARDEKRVGRRVRDHQDLGRPCLCIDPDLPAHESLCRCNEDVARPGDDLHGVEPDRRNTVCERTDRARAAHRVDLVDAEESGRAENGRVDRPTEVLLGGRGESNGCDPGNLRGHDVHHNARGVDGLAARDVEADATHGTPALDDLRTRSERRHRRRGKLGARGLANPVDCLLECGTHLGQESIHRSRDLGCSDADVRGAHAVQANGLLDEGGLSVAANIRNQA